MQECVFKSPVDTFPSRTRTHRGEGVRQTLYKKAKGTELSPAPLPQSNKWKSLNETHSRGPSSLPSTQAGWHVAGGGSGRGILDLSENQCSFNWPVNPLPHWAVRWWKLAAYTRGLKFSNFKPNIRRKKCKNIESNPEHGQKSVVNSWGGSRGERHTGNQCTVLGSR